MNRRSIAALSVCALVSVETMTAQRGGNDWMTTGSDAQRSSWIRTDGKISLASMSKPGFELVWKSHIDNAPRRANNVTQPSLIDFYIGYRGFRALGFFATSSDRVVAMDTELGRLEWESKLPPASSGAGTAQCPGGMTASVARPTGTEYPPVPNGRGGGRGTPAKSAVGEAHQGAAILKDIEARQAAMAAAPPRPAPAKPAFNAFAPRVQTVLALGSDGRLHNMYLSNGEEPKPPVSFLPPNAYAKGLIAYNNTAYVATTNNCGGASNGLWAVDLQSNKVSQWKTSKNIAGEAGPAVGPDGILYVAAGNEIVSVNPKNLEPMAIHTGGTDYSSSPVIFEHQGKNLMAVTTKDGRLELLDTEQLHRDMPYDRSAAFSMPGFDAGSVTSWQDPAGTRWILVAAAGNVVSKGGFPNNNGDVKNGAIAAFKLVDKDGIAKLQPVWTSRDMVAPLPPVVVNGVIFAASSKPSVLYALDALTGKELWSSGKTMTAAANRNGIALGGSRVYVSTVDGMEYVFGFPIEH